MLYPKLVHHLESSSRHYDQLWNRSIVDWFYRDSFLIVTRAMINLKDNIFRETEKNIYCTVQNTFFSFLAYLHNLYTTGNESRSENCPGNSVNDTVSFVRSYLGQTKKS